MTNQTTNMAFIQGFNIQEGSGGGGITINGFRDEAFEQTTAFTAGSVVLTLAQTPIAQSTKLDYNGRTMQYNVDYSVSGNEVTILFADPYVPDYEDVPYFQVNYAY